jgi:hypothetical protein
MLVLVAVAAMVVSMARAVEGAVVALMAALVVEGAMVLTASV